MSHYAHGLTVPFPLLVWYESRSETIDYKAGIRAELERLNHQYIERQHRDEEWQIGIAEAERGNMFFENLRIRLSVNHFHEIWPGDIEQKLELLDHHTYHKDRLVYYDWIGFYNALGMDDRRRLVNWHNRIMRERTSHRLS